MSARRGGPFTVWRWDAAAAAVAMSVGILATSARGADASTPLALALGVLVLLILSLRGAYDGRLGGELLDEVLEVVKAAIVGTALLVLAQIVASPDVAAARDTSLIGAMIAAALPLGRLVLWVATRHAMELGRSRRPTLILGAGKVGHLTVERLRAAPHLALQPVGFLDENPLDFGVESSGLPVLGGPADLDVIVERHGVEHVIVAFSQSQHDSMLSAIRRCWEHGLSVSIVPRLFEVEGDRVNVERVGGLPLISLRPPHTRGTALSMKYVADRAAAAVSLLALLPALSLIALAVLVSTGGPILYRQVRMGRDGCPFTLFKFRTMVGCPDQLGEADEAWFEDQRSGNATARLRSVSEAAATLDRCTPVGRLLRRWSLDELPQLWNVVRGEMSLIGPRPERVHYVKDLEGSIYRYPDRHRVKAGMTGWAQVHGLRGETSLVDRVEWDNYYIDNWSLWLDVKILLMTIRSVLRDSTRPPRDPGSDLERHDEPVAPHDDRAIAV